MSGFRNIGVAELGAMLQRDSVHLVDVRARHGEAEPSGAGVPASHLLPQSAGCASNVSEVRTDAEVARGRIPQGVSLPLHLLPMRLSELDKAKPTVFYCQMGGRSAQAAAFAVANGFYDVYNLQGGIAAWVQAGLPLEA
jgi:rhodanese-related sulfurtransferase